MSDDELEPPTRIDRAVPAPPDDDDDHFGGATLVESEAAADEPTKHDIAAATSARSKEAMARTIVQAMPGPELDPETTLMRPLPPGAEDDDVDFEEPATRLLPRDDPRATHPPSVEVHADALAPTLGRASEQAAPGPTAARPQAGPPVPAPVLLAVAGAGLVLALFVVIGLAVWVVSGDESGDPGDAVVESGEGDPSPIVVPSGPVPADEAPPLREAADLAIRGRYGEAASAYAALAREHPERAELRTMARVLHSKAGAR